MNFKRFDIFDTQIWEAETEGIKNGFRPVSPFRVLLFFAFLITKNSRAPFCTRLPDLGSNNNCKKFLALQ